MSEIDKNIEQWMQEGTGNEIPCAVTRTPTGYCIHIDCTKGKCHKLSVGYFLLKWARKKLKEIPKNG